MRTIFARLRDCFRRRTLDAAFKEEMRFHLEQLAADHRARGCSPEEARLAAVRDFGNATRAREDLRERAGFPVIEEFFRDLRHAARGLRQRPYFSVGVIIVLAVGLGAAATLSSLTRAILLAPLAVPAPDELYLVTAPSDTAPQPVSYGAARRMDALMQGRGRAAGYSGTGRFTLQRDTLPAARVTGELVTGNFFDMLRLVPAAGRLLTPADDAPDAPAVAVVGEAWAVREFGSAAAAVGREVWVNRKAVALVGVVPASFPATTLGRRSDLWMPASLQKPLGHSGNAWAIAGDDRPNDPDWTREERVSWMTVLVRVPAGSLAEAESAMHEAVRIQREQILPILDTPAEREEFSRERLRLLPAPGGFSPVRADFRPIGMLLATLVGSVLLLACANVSGLLLVRTLSRHRELGVRLALGSGRWRVGRLAIAESLILSVCGATFGWVLSIALFPVLRNLLLPGRAVSEAAFDPAQIAMIGGLVLLCTALCGVGPALLVARLEPLAALAGHGSLRGAAGRIGRLLVGAQLALAVVLVAAATSIGAEIARSLAADPGFARTQVLTTSYDARSAGYGQDDYKPLTDRLEQALRAVPGVVDVGFSASGILNGSVSRSALYFRHSGARASAEHFQKEVIRPGYFQVAGIALLGGRDLSTDDRKDAPRVAVVSAAFAREVFGSENPVGMRFGYGANATDEDFVIVGVAADTKMNGIREAAPAVFYVPEAQDPLWRLGYIAVRVQGTAAAVQRNVQSVLTRMEPGLVFTDWRTLDQRVIEDLGPMRAASQIATTFATIAILLAGAGVAASLGYLVTLRLRELALRMAIGADPDQIRRSVLIDAVRLGVVGSTIGLAIVWLVPLIPNVAAMLPARPGMLVGLVAALVGIGAAATAGWFPARRASRANLLLLLKSE